MYAGKKMEGKNWRKKQNEREETLKSESRSRIEWTKKNFIEYLKKEYNTRGRD